MEDNVHFSRYAAGAFAAATLLGTANAHAQTAPAPAPAQSGEDITALRHDMESLRQEYESRIADLEARLARAEAAEVLRIDPTCSLEKVRRVYTGNDQAESERYFAALRKAGLK